MLNLFDYKMRKSVTARIVDEEVAGAVIGVLVSADEVMKIIVLAVLVDVNELSNRLCCFARHSNLTREKY